MKSCSEYRLEAREALEGKIFSNTWLLMIVVNLIVGAVLSLLGFTVVGIILVEGPLMLGVAVYVLNVVRNNEKKNDLKVLIDGFSKDFGGTVALGFLSSLFIFLWSLLFVIPGIIKAYAYSMSFYIKADHPEYDWKKCIDESRRIMNGNKMKLFLLHLSFIGWIIVGALCLGIGTMWVATYMDTATACFYEDIKNN